MSGRGCFTIDRALWDDPDFVDEPFTEREAWIWLIGAAAWAEHRTRGNNGPITLQRGELSFSVRFLAQKWHWSKDATHRLLAKLKKRDMIRDASRDSNTVYLIKNYNDYQLGADQERDTNRDVSRDKVATPNATPSATILRQSKVLKPLNIKEEVETPSLRSGGERDDKLALFKSDVPEIPAFLDRRVKATTVLPDWMPLETWAAFVQSRKKITPHASKLLISALTKFREAGDDPKTVLEQSIMNGWRGLFPLKRMNGNGHGQRRESPHEQTERVARELIAEFDARDAARDHDRDREAGNPLPGLLAYDPGIAPGMDRDALPGSCVQIPRRAAIRG